MKCDHTFITVSGKCSEAFLVETPDLRGEISELPANTLLNPTPDKAETFCLRWCQKCGHLPDFSPSVEADLVFEEEIESNFQQQ